MKILIIIAVLICLFLAVALVVGIIVISSAADELYRDLDDRDQAAYIRRWQEEKKRKKTGRKHG